MSSPKNATQPPQTVPWLPEGFNVNYDRKECVSITRQLGSFAMYNCIAIGAFLLLSNTYAKKWITKKSRARKVQHHKWSFSSALATLIFEVGRVVLTAYLTHRSSYRASIWDLVQLWALRPRVAWFTGNFARTKREWGFVNGALSSIFTEVFVCGLATVFLGRILNATFTHFPQRANRQTTDLLWTWYMLTAASIIMLVSTGFEICWALWMLKRILEQKGRAEAQDMNSLLWVARAIPVTALCSWLIWIAFLYASQGSYCNGSIEWIDLIWGLGPVVANLCRVLLEHSLLV